MSATMRKIALVCACNPACFAHLAHGRRVSSAVGQLLSGPPSDSTVAFNPSSPGVQFARGALKPSTSQVQSAFGAVNPSSPLAGAAALRTSLEQSDPVMSARGETIEPVRIASEGILSQMQKAASKAISEEQQAQHPRRESWKGVDTRNKATSAGKEEGFFHAHWFMGIALTFLLAISYFFLKFFLQLKKDSEVSKSILSSLSKVLSLSPSPSERETRYVSESSLLPKSPKSCDTLVIVPAPESGLPVCFGKNSDRPSDEEHEVVCLPGQKHPEGTLLKCTYIEIPQVDETLKVILSKPRWIWGCEMGANECGVVGGNEAVSTRAAQALGSQERLLGMDLLRLALERGRTASEAVQVCAKLLEQYGQGGGCAEDDPSWTYENGFLFADSKEAYILETAGVSFWAVEQVPAGTFRNISNGISVGTNIHSIHDGFKQHCLDKGWWNGEEPFDFKGVLTGRSGPRSELELYGRERAGFSFLSCLHNDLGSGAVSTSSVLAKRMMDILRDEDSGICFRDLHGFNSTGSQVSLMGSGQPSGGKHYFTCSSDPKVAAYKHFDFAQSEGTSAAAIGPLSLELWRRHRKLAISRQRSKDVNAIEAASWPDGSGAVSTTMLEQLQAELDIFGKGK